MQNAIIITRHKALVAYLIEIGFVTRDTLVLPHVSSPEEIRDRHVIGPCPQHLAAEARSVIHIPINYPRDASLRGVELTIEQLREMAGPPEEYVVQRHKGIGSYIHEIVDRKTLKAMGCRPDESGVGFTDRIIAEWCQAHGLERVWAGPRQTGPLEPELVEEMNALYALPRILGEKERIAFVRDGVAHLCLRVEIPHTYTSSGVYVRRVSSQD
jgi:hypothetical protein